MQQKFCFTIPPKFDFREMKDRNSGFLYSFIVTLFKVGVQTNIAYR